MKDGKIDISNFSDFQKQSIFVLIQCFENDLINFDKFILWHLRNCDIGTSVILNLLANSDVLKPSEDEKIYKYPDKRWINR